MAGHLVDRPKLRGEKHALRSPAKRDEVGRLFIFVSSDWGNGPTVSSRMKRSPAPRQLSFESRLERLASGINYFALPVPAQITRALGTRGPVPVAARVNGSEPFLVSLYTQGGGRHGLRVKAEVRTEAKLKEGDRVRVKITVRDRAAETALPPDLANALRAERVLEDFKALPKGKLSYTLRWIDQAARPVTREKRIQDAVALAHQRREQRVDRPA